jgi:DNA-binding NarL/FixJ family response regulator
MNVTTKNNQDSPTPFYNICIVDKSNIYALGLKKSIEKSLNKTADSFIFFHQNIEEINPLNITPIDILFIDYNDLLIPHFNGLFAKMKKKNPSMKLIISSSDLLQIDFIKLYAYNINGLFSKSLSSKSFNIYFKRVLAQTMYIDHNSIGNVITQEKSQKIRFYYKCISLQNLELIQHRYQHYTPYFVNKDTMAFLEK